MTIQVPVMFFQVTSTAIPAILIAMAIGGKFGEGLSKAADSARSRFAVALVMVIVGAVMLFAEVLSLLAVASNGADVNRGVFVMVAVSLGVYLIAYQLFWPSLKQLDGWRSNVIVYTWSVSWAGAVAISWYSLNDFGA